MPLMKVKNLERPTSLLGLLSLNPRRWPQMMYWCIKPISCWTGYKCAPAYIYVFKNDKGTKGGTLSYISSSDRFLIQRLDMKGSPCVRNKFFTIGL